MEFIPEGANIHKTRYKEILGRFRDSIHLKRPELWCKKNWLLLDDNVPAYRSVLVQEELARQQITTFPHPPYSPDLAPCDFSLFSRMKALLHGRKFHSAEEVMTATRDAVRDLPASMFQWCYQQLQAYQRLQNNGLLLHDNASAYRSVLVQEELARQQITTFPHPPYSPDLAPCDFPLFSRTKSLLHGCRFHSAEEVMTATRDRR